MYEESFIITSFLLFLIYKNLFNKNQDINEINTENLNKMYNIIYQKGELYNDIYNRKISKKVAYKFLIIANKLNININNVDDESFNNIYIEYVNNLIKKYDK